MFLLAYVSTLLKLKIYLLCKTPLHQTNPATNQLNIEATELIESIEVYDLIGKMIMQQFPIQNQTVLNFNIHEGIYLVKVKQKNSVASIHKITVTK